MKPGNEVFTGVLANENGRAFLRGDRGKLLAGEHIWNGYLIHWTGERVCARFLPQRDYETDRPIVILWPDSPAPAEPFADLYYNERLVKYSGSILGHLAINVGGEIFNFSHFLHENEILSPEEYFYRPALGEFAPDPRTGRYNISDMTRPYFDRFGRNFMRSIHVCRILGIDAARLSGIFRREIEVIRAAEPDPRRPAEYPDFNIVTRSCATIIRDGLREYGFRGVSGFAPRDLFVNAARYLIREARKGRADIRLFLMPQLKVPEADWSRRTPFLNPLNWSRGRGIPDNKIFP